MNSTLPSSNITAALDLSVPPPQINSSVINNKLTSSILPYLFQPPPTVSQHSMQQQNIVPTKNLLSSVTVTIQSSIQGTGNPVSTNAQTSTTSFSISQQQQQSQFSLTATATRVSNGPVPLMSIEQPHPSGFLGNRNNPNNVTGIRSLASILPRKQLSGKRNQAKRTMFRLSENDTSDSQKQQNNEPLLESVANESQDISSLNADLTLTVNEQDIAEADNIKIVQDDNGTELFHYNK